MNKYLGIFKNWFGYAAVVSMLCGIIYIVAQQNFRLSANDVPYQLAHDAATGINDVGEPKQFPHTGTPVEITESLAPWLLVCDANGNALSNGALLDGKTPRLPQGVFDKAKKEGVNMVTWQPRPGVRQATVMVHTTVGYTVVAGQSLTITEDHISMLGTQVVFGWMLSLVAMLVVVTVQEMMTRKFGLD
jgi:hypothetical protein